MNAITFDQIKIEAPFVITKLLNLRMLWQANAHSVLELRAYIAATGALDALQETLYGQEIKASDRGAVNFVPIFAGIVYDVLIEEASGQFILSIKAVSGTKKLDETRNSRSFQNVDMTYADVVRQVICYTPDAAVICAIGEDQPIGRPIIQYNETDWDFIRRMASHFYSGIVPATTESKPWIYFGMREDAEPVIFSETAYDAVISDQFYRMGGAATGFDRSHFFYYVVRDLRNHEIGAPCTFREKSLRICEKQAEFIRGELIFTYKLAKETLIGQRMFYNEQITGLSIDGTVLKTANEVVWLHLDIDGEHEVPAFPYSWAPPSGNLMYLMPKIGTKAVLYFNSHDERTAKATCSPRANGGLDNACAAMGDYNNRCLTTEHGKQLYWYPGSMGAIGTGSPGKPLQMMLDDASRLLLESDKKMEFTATDTICIEAPHVVISTPTEMKVFRTPAAAAHQAKINAIGTGHT